MINGNHSLFVHCKGLGNFSDGYNGLTCKQHTKKKEVEQSSKAVKGAQTVSVSLCLFFKSVAH